MISAPDRQRAVELIDEARNAGTRPETDCRLLDIASWTFQCWTRQANVRSDGRPDAVKPRPTKH